MVIKSKYMKEKTPIILEKVKNKDMVKYLMTIPYFFLWILYFLFTLEERNRYSESLKMDMDCINSVTRLNSTIFEFDKNEKPTRRYLTWKEFWNKRGYLLKNSSTSL